MLELKLWGMHAHERKAVPERYCARALLCWDTGSAAKVSASKPHTSALGSRRVDAATHSARHLIPR